MSFVHLHVHSEYSLLDGLNNVEALIKAAKSMGMPALALTDHGTMYGAIEFHNKAKTEGIKPIIGVEAYIAPNGMQSRDPKVDKKSTHLLLLAENQIGYKNLLKLVSAAQLEGFYYYPRIDHEILTQHAEGLICTSGCMSAEIPKAIAEGKLSEASQTLDLYFEVFGPERFYLELQHHDIEELPLINRTLFELGKRYNAKFIATNDIHYIKPEHADLQDILLAIQTGKLLSDPDRLRMSDKSYHMRSPEEMSRLFNEVPEAIRNTLLIAERCELDLEKKEYHLPIFNVPEGYTAHSYLRELCETGLYHQYGDRADDSEIHERLEYELNIIHNMGFDTYFLIVWDLCRHARDKGIWYNARGSAAGSIVAYCLDITLVDPLRHGLIFERFLNPGRISMPDIDLDFRDDRRAEMMEYCAQKFGEDKVAQIITFGTLKARAAIRDVGRVKDIPLNEVDRIAKLIPNIPGNPITIQQSLDMVKELRERYESTGYVKDLINTAMQIEGCIRNAGTHAAGVIITDKPVIEYVPLHRPTGNVEESPIKTVTQYDMNALEVLGLLKVDFLGLATLTIMARACELIHERHGVELNLKNIPTDDPVSYELLGRGETAGIFQVEGSGMRRCLMKMKPKLLEHVIAMVALYRPGPMEFINDYLNRMHGKAKPVYRHPALEPIFKETYGIPVYQEQLIRAAMEIAGYNAPEADNLRKAVAKKKKKVLQRQREKFIAGAEKNGIPTETAAAIFDDWEEFARYGFNKAHAADYGLIAVQTAYLKTYYPVEYMTALLSVSQNDTDKVAYYVFDCRRMGIDVLPPDINLSGWDFTIQDRPDNKQAIRFGLGAVKNVGRGAVEAILSARAKEPFKNLNDFIYRVDLRQVGKRTLECLIRVGALDQFGARPALLEALDRIIGISTSHHRACQTGQISFFGSQTGLMGGIKLTSTATRVSQREQLKWERDLLGLYVSDHPLNAVIDDLNRIITHFSGELSEVSHNTHVRIAGLITYFLSRQTKSGSTMGFVTLEDLQGRIELLIFPKIWQKVSSLIEPEKIIVVEGRVDTQSSEPKILVDNITTELTLVVPLDEMEPDQPLPKDQTDEPCWPTIPVSDSPSPSQEEIDQVFPLEETFFESEEEEQPAIIEPSPSILSRAFEVEEVVVAQPVSVAGRPEDEEDVEEPASRQEFPTSSSGSQPWAEPPKSTSISETGHPHSHPATQEPTSKKAEPLPQALILPPYIIPPKTRTETGDSPRMITIILRASEDNTRDVLRLRRAYGILSAYPGEDHFAFYILEGERSFLIEFPNFTTGVCDDLLDRLHKLVNPENVRVEPITIQ
ncbi:MAG: DNA polymerase III subunit alpha [Chloroflexota bacterium]